MAIAVLEAYDESLKPKKYDFCRTLVHLYDAEGKLKPSVKTYNTFTELAVAMRPAIYGPLAAKMLRMKKNHAKRKRNFFKPRPYLAEEEETTIEIKNLKVKDLQKIKIKIQAQLENLKTKNQKKLRHLKHKKIHQIIKNV